MRDQKEKQLNTTVSLTRIEKMRLPDLSKDNCVNHPNVKAFKKHLCSECYVKWEASLLKFEIDKQSDRDFENDREQWFDLRGKGESQ